MVGIFLDSGAYSAWTKKVEIKIDDYIAFIKRYEKDIALYANLDVIGDAEASFQNQKYIESKGLKPLPCFHQGEDVKYLQHYISNYEYMALGGMVGGSNRSLVLWLNDIFTNHICDKKGLPRIKIHGFGLTSIPLMVRYPWYSVDSTTYLLNSSWGIIFLPGKKNGKYSFLVSENRVSVSGRSPWTKDEGRHFQTLSKSEKQEVIRYVEEKGFIIGESTFNEEGEETVVVKGLCNDLRERIAFNSMFMADIEKALPQWPWAFKSILKKDLGL